MLRKLSHKKAQAVMSEYVLIFFIIAAVMSTMTVFFKRAVQARIRDARVYMINSVYQRAMGPYYNDEYLGNNIRWGYEPYYANSSTAVEIDEYSRDELYEGGSTGIYQKHINEYRLMRTVSNVAPPHEAN